MQTRRMLSTIKRDADKKDANLKTLGSDGLTAENSDGQTADLAEKNLGFNVTELAETDSNYSAIPCCAVNDETKRESSIKMDLLPEPIIPNMAIRGKTDNQKCSATEMLI
jgi:hypothetical protein